MLKMIHWFAVMSLAYLGLASSGESLWTISPKVQVTGLTKISETRLEICLRICLYIEWCNVVSYDSEATLPCEIQTSSMGVGKSNETKDSVTTYTHDKINIASGEKCWIAVPGKTAKNFQASSHDAHYECMLYCIGIWACEAVVFDPMSKPSCWYHVGVSGSVKEEDLIPQKGATTYLLDKSCLFPAGV